MLHLLGNHQYLKDYFFSPTFLEKVHQGEAKAMIKFA